MIENMRKYTGLMVVVLILLAAGLVITMKPGGSGGGGVGNEFMHVNGVALDRNDFSKEGKNTVAAIQRLYQTGDYITASKLGQFAQALSGNANNETQSHINFVTNRILLKQKAQELGLYSSPEVAEQFIQDNMFQNRDGGFDTSLYASYIESLANMGLKQKDFQQLVAEYIVFTKARDLVGGGLTPSNLETLAEDKLTKQSIALSTVTFDIEDFKKELSPTEEEVQAYWNTHKDAYKTDRQLKVTYVLTLLDDSDQPVRPTPAPDADPAATAKLNIEFQDKLASWTDQRKNHTKILTKLFSDFVDAVQDSEGKDFDKEAAAAKEEAGADFTIVTTEAFSIDSAPAELSALALKNYAPGTKLVAALFERGFNEELLYNIDSYSVGRDGNIAVRIDEELKPVVKSFEDAKELAKADFITKKATEAMVAAAESAKTKLTELVTSGKSFNDAATENNFTAKSLEPFTASTAPSDSANAADYFRIAQVTAPKTVATEISESADSAAVVYVATRTIEVAKDDTLQETQILDRAENQMMYISFNAWINSLQDGANLKLPLAQ